jgi:hypothetical protein
VRAPSAHTQTQRKNLEPQAATPITSPRRLGLQDTELERATPGTIRTRLLQVGARTRRTAWMVSDAV